MATQDKEMAVERSTIPAQSHPMTNTGHHTTSPGSAVPVLDLSPESIVVIEQELQRWKGKSTVHSLLGQPYPQSLER